jgi:hypothetical protein
MFDWAIKKGKQLLNKILTGNVENEIKAEPTKIVPVATPKKNTEPIKWPLPVKK